MQNDSGMTLVEILAVLAIISLAVGVAVVQLRPLEAPLDTATSQVEGLCREARLSAIASTSAYRLSPDGHGGILAEHAASCSSTTWTLDSRMGLTLPSGVSMTPSSWTACFSSRGISSTGLTIALAHSQYGTRSVEILVGGTTRVLK